MTKRKKPYIEPVQSSDVETTDNSEAVSAEVIESVTDVDVESDMLEEQGPSDIVSDEPDVSITEQVDAAIEEMADDTEVVSVTSDSEGVVIEFADEQPETEVAAEEVPVVDPEPAVAKEEVIAELEQVSVETVAPQSIDEVETVGEYTVDATVSNEPEAVQISPLEQVRFFLGEPVNFPVDMCEEILATKQVPSRTRRGNWLVDTQREKSFDKWSLETIYDFLDGSIQLSGPEAEDLAWSEIYRRYQLSPGTYHDDAIAWITAGTPVPVTKSGLLARDSVRESLDIEHWTYKELRATLLGEIKHPFTDEQFISRLREVSGVDDRFDTDKLVEITLEKGYGTMTHNTLESRLEQYKRIRYGSGRQSAKVIGDNHAILLREIRRQLDQEYPLFAEGWKILLAFVKREMNTLFNDKVRYDSWKQVPLSGADLRALEDVLTLLVMSVEDDARKNGLPVDMVRGLTTHLTTEENQQKLLAFYSR